MKRQVYYILEWFEDKEGNRTAKTAWEGIDPNEARTRFNEAEVTAEKPFVEAYMQNPDGDDYRLEIKWY